MKQKAETTTLAGQAVTIRPIRTTDAAMEAAFIKKLSLQTKHYRFFGGVKELSAEAIGHLCATDGPHSMAFVATVQEAGSEVEIGVCRYAPDSNADVREMAVTIADEWLHQGVGELLMKHLVTTAKHHGVRRLYSLELHDNQMMRDLANVLGMTALTDPHDAQQVVYSLLI
jgi:GNAT superfamily N-acetyltransferase